MVSLKSAGENSLMITGYSKNVNDDNYASPHKEFPQKQKIKFAGVQGYYHNQYMNKLQQVKNIQSRSQKKAYEKVFKELKDSQLDPRLNNKNDDFTKSFINVTMIDDSFSNDRIKQKTSPVVTQTSPFSKRKEQNQIEVNMLAKNSDINFLNSLNSTNLMVNSQHNS